MQKKLIRKVVAGALSVAMLLGMTTMSFAVTGTETGDATGTGVGEFEGYVDKDVMAVVLPTIPADGNLGDFEYKVDPTGVINDTDAEKYKDAEGNVPEFEEGASVFFKNSATSYTDESNKLKVINKGTVAAEITASVKLKTPPSGYSMNGTGTFAENTSAAELYLALVTDGVAKTGDAAISAVAITGTTAVDMTVVLAGNDKNFEVKYDTTSPAGYKFKEKANVPDTAWNSIGFGLTGKANNVEAWENVTDVADVEITWSYANGANSTETAVKENAQTGPAATLSADGVLTITGLTEARNVVDASNDIQLGVDDLLYPMDGAACEWDVDEWNATTGGTLIARLDTQYNVYNGKEVKVEITLKDGSKIECSAVVNIQ